MVTGKNIMTVWLKNFGYTLDLTILRDRIHWNIWMFRQFKPSHTIIITSPPWGVRTLAIFVSVYLSVCLSLRSHVSKTVIPTSRNLPCVLPVAVARCSSDGTVQCVTYFRFCGCLRGLREIFSECQRMAKVPNAVEILPKISTGWVWVHGRYRQTDRRQTDGHGRQHIATFSTKSKI